jgi:hypothetical protein
MTPRLITAFGETKHLAEWTRDPRCTIADRTLLGRLNTGWPPEKAITEPARVGKNVYAFGEWKTILQWVQDSRCPITKSTLQRRLRRGWRAEDAITYPSTTK